MMMTFFRTSKLGVLAALGLAGGLLGSASATPDTAVRTSDRIVSSKPDRPPLNFVYFDAESHQQVWGDAKDMDDARRLLRPGEPLLWFREDRQVGKEYVIRDAALIKQFDDLFKPLKAIGDDLGKVGGQQGGLGAQLGALANQQSLLFTRQSALVVREAALGMRADADGLAPAQAEDLAKQRRELRRQRRSFDKQTTNLGKSMRELSSQMSVLTQEIQGLEKKMQLALGKSTAEAHELFRRSIASGAAKPAR